MRSSACNVCGVEYDPEYEGPCQEFSPFATDDQICAGTPPMCRGTVSRVATLEQRITELEAARAHYTAETERLREALEKIAALVPVRQFTPTTFGGFLRDPAELSDAVRLARAALAPDHSTTPLEAKTMPASDAERNSVELAAQMHDLSVHLWNALEREYQPSEPQYHWTTCDLREEIESMQGLLKSLSAVRLVHSTTKEG